MCQENCLFCKIAAGKIPSEKVYEDDFVYAFKDISPVAPVHFLVIPKKHIESALSLEASDIELVGKVVYAARRVAAEFGLDKSGARFIFNSGEAAGQTVFHLHMHVLGGRSFGWPPFSPDAVQN